MTIEKYIIWSMLIVSVGGEESWVNDLAIYWFLYSEETNPFQGRWYMTLLGRYYNVENNQLWSLKVYLKSTSPRWYFSVSPCNLLRITSSTSYRRFKDDTCPLSSRALRSFLNPIEAGPFGFLNSWGAHCARLHNFW